MTSIRRTRWNEQRPILHLKQSEIPELRQLLLDRQRGVCPICGKMIVRACLDHSHIKRIKGTGRIRGVVCNHCNVFLSKSENNALRYAISQKDLPQVLRNMADYLERPHLPILHPKEQPRAPRLMLSSWKQAEKMWKVVVKRRTFPNYPRSGKMTKKLRAAFAMLEMEPKYYS